MTRLRLKILWLVHAYRFLWAHKPLCQRFRDDVLRFGGVHVCRSCTFAWTGLFLGSVLGFLGPESFRAAAPTALVVLAVVTVVLSHDRWYKKWPRTVRDVLRLTMGIVVALCATVVLAHPLPGFLAGLVLLLFWTGYLHRRRHRLRRACDGCPELSDANVCSGFALQAQQMMKYEEQATRIVMATDYVPLTVRRYRPLGGE